MEFKLENEIMTVFLPKEINSTNAEEIGAQIDESLEGKKFNSIILDFSNCSYISSAGLRIVLRLKQAYNEVSIINTSLEVYDIFQMTGFTSIMDVKKALRNIDISHAEVIGDGFFSTVYRLDKDTIVKVFTRTSDPNQIQRELFLAKEAFVLGVPTAISFDIVKAGDKLGVCFEMLDCQSLKNVILSDKAKYDEYIKKYADLLKKINTTECLNESIPDMKKSFLKKVEGIKPYLDEKHYLKAKQLVESIEDRKTFIHGDCHFKNIMVQNGELILIDMDTLSVGHPIFELACLYAPYCAFNEDDPGNSERFFGIKDEDAVNLYKDLLALYFGKLDDAILDKIKLIAYIHMVWWNRTNEPNNEVRLNGCRERLIKLLDQYNDLNIGI